MRPDIGLAEDDESGLIEHGEQLRPGSQFQMFGQVGQQEPALSSRFQVRRLDLRFRDVDGATTPLGGRAFVLSFHDQDRVTRDAIGGNRAVTAGAARLGDYWASVACTSRFTPLSTMLISGSNAVLFPPKKF